MRNGLYFGVACLVLLTFGTAGWGDASAEAEGHVESAKKLAAASKFAEAAEAMKKALELAPKNELYLALASDFENQAGFFAEGLAHARKGIELNGKVGTYYVLAAANAYGTQDITAAREYLQTVLKRRTEFGPQVMQAARRVEGLLSKKIYTLQWDLDPRKGTLEAGVYRLALPQNNLPYQSVTYKVTGAKSHKLVKTEANHLLHVVPQGTKPFQVSMEIAVQPVSYKDKLAASKNGPLPKEVQFYLGYSVGIDPNSPALKKIVAKLKRDDAADTVREIAWWMKKNISYKNNTTAIEKVDFKSVDEILERGYGECYAYSLLFTALCRSAGVPARQIWGLYMKPEGGGFASHNWAEVSINGVGWVPIDPQVPASLGMLPNTHIRFIMPLKATPKGNEALPQVNLLYMSGGEARYETKVEGFLTGSP